MTYMKKKEKVESVELRMARKAINDYLKLVKKEEAMWKKRCKMHEKEMLKLCDVYIKIKEKKGVKDGIQK